MKKVVFIHIPRTSGKSFWNNIRKYVPLPHSTLGTWEGYEMAHPSKVQEFRLVGGHVSPAITVLVGGEPYMVTLFRDPIQRIVSHYKYLLRHPWWVEANSHAGNLAGFLSSPKSTVYVDNTMCRYIGTNLNKAHVRDEWRRTTLDPIMEWSVENERIEEVCERAMERIDDFFLVGLKERHRESVELFLRKFKSKELPEAKTILRQDHVAGLSPSDLEMLYPFVKYDAILYQKAKSIFEAEYGNKAHIQRHLR